MGRSGLGRLLKKRWAEVLFVSFCIIAYTVWIVAIRSLWFTYMRYGEPGIPWGEVAERINASASNFSELVIWHYIVLGIIALLSFCVFRLALWLWKSYSNKHAAARWLRINIIFAFLTLSLGWMFKFFQVDNSWSVVLNKIGSWFVVGPAIVVASMVITSLANLVQRSDISKPNQHDKHKGGFISAWGLMIFAYIVPSLLSLFMNEPLLTGVELVDLVSAFFVGVRGNGSDRFTIANPLDGLVAATPLLACAMLWLLMKFCASSSVALNQRYQKKSDFYTLEKIG